MRPKFKFPAKIEMVFFLKYKPSDDDLTSPNSFYIKISKWYKHQEIKNFALNLQLQVIQILTKDVQMLIFCLSYSFTTVVYFIFRHLFWSNFDEPDVI